ncbi:MAG: methenyltetrahydromethanopterin cyclohydrolase, partial [Candidatus Heimdallarchaeota archaeon]|nr:methenyltetrahydromethanopterin cyclohydrolase [Candidatus Heimdallarchaeota archaeon]
MMTELQMNQRAIRIITELIMDAPYYGVEVFNAACGTTVIDIGVNVNGSYLAGLRTAEASLGGLAQCRMGHSFFDNFNLPSVITTVNYPSIATLGSQFATWYFDDIAKGMLIGGPARAIARNPPDLFADLNYKEMHSEALVVIEGNQLPCEKLYQTIADACDLLPSHLFAIIAPTNSLAGATQIASRAIE